MVGSRSPYVAVLVLVMVCYLGQPGPLWGPTTTMLNTTNTCIVNTLRYINGPGTFIGINKYLAVSRVCNTAVPPVNAGCNPGAAANTMALGATAAGGQITMMPSCQWACVGCANITTNGTNGGLPVELMDFGIEDGDGTGNESGADSVDH